MKNNQPVTTATEVAKYIIWFAHKRGSSITNLKLQKLLYYAQGWHLVFYDRPLFGDKIEAWIRGPVVPIIYHQYQGYRYRSIDEDVAPPQFDSTMETAYLKDFLNDFLQEFLSLDAFEMERMAHREQPWIEARGGLPPDARCTQAISCDTMKTYFKALAANG